MNVGSLPWYIARSGGLVAWGLLTASVIWGLLLSTKVLRGTQLGARARPAWILDLHRWLGGLALTFTGVHVLALLADSSVHFSLTNVLVPFTASWRPAAVAWGVVGLYLLAAVELTSLAKRHIPHKVWRLTHVVAFPLFAATTIHAVTAGTDATSWLIEGFFALGTIAVGALTSVRLGKLTGGIEAATPQRIPAAARRSTAEPRRTTAFGRPDAGR